MLKPTLAADNSFMRELKRLLQALTSVADDNSLVRLVGDYYRYVQFAAGKAQHNSDGKQPELMPQLWFLAEKILRLTEGNNAADCLIRSAKLLGCLQLTAPDSQRRWSELQFGYKLLYRAALSLRLLDHALQHSLLTDEKSQQLFRQRLYADDDCQYRQQVQLPLVVALMLLDVGQLQPEATALLTGYAGERDASRSMSQDEREHYLQLTQAGMLQLADDTLQVLPYRGNSKIEKQQLALAQQQQLALIRQLLSAQPADSPLGYVIKVPQVYSSIVLPGRQRYQYDALPKASLVLKEAVRRGQLSGTWVQHFLRITGVFPQGFGITFIPAQYTGLPGEKYELAIVNQLYPPNAAEPLCRVVSRNLQYRRGGHNCQISIDNNLYFKPARQRLSVIAPQRLQEILAQLSAGWQPGQIRHYLPRCWQPQSFFSHSQHQNLWNQARNIVN